MVSNHTRGTWWSGKVCVDPNTGQRFGYVSATEDGMTYPICRVYSNKDSPVDADANLNLITHAQQMYECLKQILSYTNGETLYDPHDVVANLRRLVAELDGEEDS